MIINILFYICLFVNYSLVASSGETSIEKEQIKQIEDLKAQGINAADAQGRTPLYLAVQFNQPKVVKDLLQDKSIEINKADNDGLTPLAVAIDESNIEIVNYLLENCPKSKETNQCESVNHQDSRIGFTPLIRAAKMGNEAIVKALLDAGANPYIESKSGKIATNFVGENKDIAKLIEDKEKEYSQRALEFMKALNANNAGEARKLLIAGINVNAKDNDGYSPLFAAARKGHKEIVRMLINAKADLNAKEKYIGTPLLVAAKKGFKEIAQMLIDAGADVNEQDILGNTPLALAALQNNKDLVQMLIKAKADFNVKDSFGRSPLMLATLLNYKDMVQMLKDAGAKE